MFDVNIEGLKELEAGREPAHLAFEPVANVFDEARGYGDEDRKRPTICHVTLEYSANPRGVRLIVEDDGAGFSDERDIYTFFGTSAKRDTPGVAGRFNSGEKLLIAAARTARVQSMMTTVDFADGKRTVTNHRTVQHEGTRIEVLMPWTQADMRTVQEMLFHCIAPEGLDYRLNGMPVGRPALHTRVQVTLPTVKMEDGMLKRTTRKCRVDVYSTIGEGHWLMELGIPVCSLDEVGFPWSLDIQQKVPVPQSRDMVDTAYLRGCIGRVVEQASMDGCKLLSEAEQGSGFVKDALDHITQPEAMAVVIKDLYGDNVVRASSDPVANAKASAAGATVIPGRWFGTETRKMLDSHSIMPTAHARYGGSEGAKPEGAKVPSVSCPNCGTILAL